MARKTDEHEKQYFRSDRFFTEGEGRWYYTTREDGIQGPFKSRDEAEQALNAWLATSVGVPESLRDPWGTPGASR